MFKPWKKENGKKVATWHLSFLLGMILLITGLDYMGRPFQQCTYDHYFEQGTPNHNRWSEAVRKRIECEEKIKKVRELGSSNSEIQKLILELRNLEEKVHEAENRLLCVKTSIWSRKKE